MATTAFCARAGIPNKGKGIDTLMSIIPGDGQLAGLSIGSNAGRFHLSKSPKFAFSNSYET